MSSYLLDTTLVQPKLNLDINEHGDRLAIFGCRLKSPVPHSFNGLLIQPQAKLFSYPYVPRIAIRSDYHAQNGNTLVLGRSRRF